jgi:LAO/AO transport system kinase
MSGSQALRRAAQPAELLELAGGGPGGDRRSLARLLSVAEQGGAVGRDLARLTYPRSGAAYSVGITGAPGAGKSTLTARLIAEALQETGESVAVLAIDPTSPLSGGAILGDRVRMQEHALNRMVYIRSMATRGHLGGLAAAVPDAVRVFDAAASCDTVVVVLNPGWGDAVQANKAGLLEVADVLVINKADRPGVRETKRDLVHMLQLSHDLEWMPPIVETVASSGDGIHDLWAALSAHRAHLESAGGLDRRRTARLVEETERLAAARLAAGVAEELHGSSSTLIDELAARRINPAEAADRIVIEVAGSLMRQDRSEAPAGDPSADLGSA